MRGQMACACVAHVSVSTFSSPGLGVGKWRSDWPQWIEKIGYLAAAVSLGRDPERKGSRRPADFGNAFGSLRDLLRRRSKTSMIPSTSVETGSLPEKSRTHPSEVRTVDGMAAAARTTALGQDRSIRPTSTKSALSALRPIGCNEANSHYEPSADMRGAETSGRLMPNTELCEPMIHRPATGVPHRFGIES